MFLISRRSRHRAGTRYKRRGVDEKGKCANFVETEQVRNRFFGVEPIFTFVYLRVHKSKTSNDAFCFRCSNLADM